MSQYSRNDIQKLENYSSDLFSLLKKYADGNIYDVNNLGVEYDINNLLLFFTGSIDYYNKILIQETSGTSDSLSKFRHPLSLRYLDDKNISYGFINNDIISVEIPDPISSVFSGDFFAGSSLHLHSAPYVAYYWETFTDETTFPRGVYPSWDGYPSLNDALLDYPTGADETTRIPVFTCGEWIVIRNDSSTSVVYDDTFSIDISEQIKNSFDKLSGDFNDIRIFRLKNFSQSASPDMNGFVGSVTSLSADLFVELPRTIDGTDLIFQVGDSTETGLSFAQNELIVFALYWSSPDIPNQMTEYPLVTPAPSDPYNQFAFDYTIATGKHYNWFFKNRTDYLKYENQNPTLKAKNFTNFSANEDDMFLYEPFDPKFYNLLEFFYNFDQTSWTEYGEFSEEMISTYLLFNGGAGIFNGQTQSGIGLRYDQALSINHRDENGNYPDVETICGIIIGVKTEVDMSMVSKNTQLQIDKSTLTYNYSGVSIKYKTKKGPDVFPDKYPKTLDEFNYYPELDDGYLPFIKIIVGQKTSVNRSGESPRAFPLYIEFTDSYSSRGIDNVEFSGVLSKNIVDLWINYYSNLPKYIASNLIFSSYMAFIASQTGVINSNSGIVDILDSHSKYSTGGQMGIVDEIRKILDSNDAVASFDSNLTVEVLSEMYSLEPWYINLVYWKSPQNHNLKHFDFSDETNWATAYSRGIDTSRSFVSYYPGDGSYDDSITSFDRSNWLTTKQDRDDATKTGLILKDREMINQSQLEIYFPPADAATLASDNNSNVLNQDYSLKLFLVDKNHNTVDKEIFLTNANYFISDVDLNTKIDNNEIVEQYITPTTINSIEEYKNFGDASIIPDARNGGSYKIYMKVFSPSDENRYTKEEYFNLLYEEYSSDIEEGGKVAYDAWQEIRTQMSDYADTIGWNDTDLRTLTNKYKKISKTWLGVTKYNFDKQTGIFNTIPWEIKYTYLFGYSDETVRWGYKVNNQWFYQNFNQDLVVTNRQDYINSHIPEDALVKRQDRHEIFNDIDFALNGNVSFLAQTFTPDFLNVARRVDKISLYLYRVGEISSTNLVLTICELASNRPDKIISVSDFVNSNDVELDDSQNGNWVDFNFSKEIYFQEGLRYAMVLTTLEKNNNLNSESKIVWRFAEDNTYSYGVTNTFTFLTQDVSSGDTVVYVEDLTSFPDTPFFISINNDLYYITNVSYDSTMSAWALSFSDYEYPEYDNTGLEYPEYTWYINILTESYSSGTIVYLVNFYPYDPENRFYSSFEDEYKIIMSDWELPEYSNHDASYRIYMLADTISDIYTVGYSDWFGDDLELNNNAYADSFYITGASGEYDPYPNDSSEYFKKLWLKENFGWYVNPSNTVIYSWAPGMRGIPINNSKVLGGFNVAGVGDFPKSNNFRAGTINKVDSFWAWSTDKLEVPDQIVILPQANISTSSISYLPIVTNTFLTIGLVRSDGTRKVINKIIYGKNHDFGTIVDYSGGVLTLSSDVLNSSDPDYLGQWTTVSTDQFVRKELWIMDGQAATLQGSSVYITSTSDSSPGDNQYEVELLTAFNVEPQAGDHYAILLSTVEAVETGTITNNPIPDTVSGTTTIQDTSKTWDPVGNTDEDFTGLDLWLIDGDASNTIISIESNTSNTITYTTTTRTASSGSKYAILKTNEDAIGFYGTKGPIVIDSEKFIGVDHMSISSEKFPSDYWDGMSYTDAFIIRGSIDVSG